MPQTPIALPATCLVYVWLKDILDADIGSVQSAKLSVRLTGNMDYGGYLILPFSKSVNFDSNGYAQIQLAETTSAGGLLVFSIICTIGKTVKQVNFYPAMVPNSGAASLTSFANIA